MTRAPAILTLYRNLVGLAVKTKPTAVSFAVCAHLVSQVSMLLAFLLPLKILILMGSDGVPRYFPGYFRSFDSESLVLVLSASALVFYVLHLAFDRIGSRVVETLSHDVLHATPAFQSTAIERAASEKAMGDLTRSMTGGVYALLAILLLAVLYPMMAWFTTLLLSAVGVVVLVAARSSPAVRAGLEQNLEGFTQGVFAVGFLLGFAVIVADFLVPIDPPTVLYALIGLILVRQLLSNLASSVVRAGRIWARSEELGRTLRVTGPTAGALRSRREEAFWQLLEPEAIEQWMPEVLSMATPSAAAAVGKEAAGKEAAGYQWFETSTPGIVTLRVQPALDVEEHSAFLVRLFSDRLEHYGERESIFLNHFPAGKVALPFAGETRVRGFRCHLLKWADYVQVSKGALPARRLEVLLALAAIPPADVLVESQARSRPMLWQRLGALKLDRLKLAAGPEELTELERARAVMPKIVRIIARLPLQVTKVRFSNLETVCAEDEDTRIIGWGDWRVEPLGAGWTRDWERLEERLPEIVESVNAARRARVSGPEVMLAALMSEFESCYVGQRFSEALGLLPRAIGWLGACERCRP